MKRSRIFLTLCAITHISMQGAMVALSEYFNSLGMVSQKTSDYSPMKLSSSSFEQDTYIPVEKPLSPDKGDEQWDKQEKCSLDPKIVTKAIVSSQGTFAAIIKSESGNYLVSRNSLNLFKKYQICKDAPYFDISFWNENILALGSNGQIQYVNRTDNFYQSPEMPSCVPQAMVVHETGNYAIVAVISPTYGQLFYFYQITSTRSPIASWPILGLKKHTLSHGVTALSQHPTDNSFAVATSDGAVKLWNIVEKENKQEWMLPGPCMNQDKPKKILVLLQYASYIAGASSQEDLTWWDTCSLKETFNYTKCHKDVITSFKHLKDYVYVSGSLDGTVKLWDVRKTKLLNTMTHGSPVAAITRLSEDTFVSCSKNSVIKYWDFYGKQLPSK